MLIKSSWPIVPVEILRRAFELQPDGLDNCAASATCKAWRAALTDSAASSIYLYAITDSQEQRWHSLLSSRSSIKSLNLVRAASWTSSNDWCKLQRSTQIGQTTLDSIPTACRALTLSEFCSHHLVQYVAKAPQLEQLSFEWGALPFESFKEMHLLPNLTPLCRLTKLEVKMENDVFGDMFAQLVIRCPASLQSLQIRGFGSDLDGNQPPPCSLQTLNMLEHYLPALTELQLYDCTVTIPGEDITCLSRLNSLSLANSEVYVDGALEIERLTALTHLDLTDTTCYWGDAWIEVLDTFTAWPGLLGLKISGCNLFDAQTRVILGTVQEAHVMCPVRLDLTSESNVQLHMNGVLPLMGHEPFQSMPAQQQDACRKLLAGLNLHPTKHRGQVREILQQLSTDFPNLRSLVFEGIFPVVAHSYDFSVLSNLTNLQLQALGCSAFSLQCLSSLINLDLQCTDEHYHVCHVLLPTSLQALTFSGFGLFAPDTQQNLLDLACLSTAEFVHYCSAEMMPSWRPRMPKLPCCVIYLKLPTSVSLEGFIDWTISDRCQSVRYLTLQNLPASGGPLHEWVRSLPNLFVVDYMRVSDNDEPYITRIPAVVDIPDWFNRPRFEGS